MPPEKYDYMSVFSPQERWNGDDVDFYKDIVRRGGSRDVSVSEARVHLQFYEIFDPRVPHDRTIAQVVKVGVLKDPKWSKSGRLILPIIEPLDPPSALEKQVETDFGDMARKISEGSQPGVQPNDYFGVRYTPRDVGKRGITMVRLTLLPCSYEHPFLFTVLHYFAVDGQRVSENQALHRPAFNPATHQFVKYVRNAASSRTG